jgi:hypothetical protein
MRDEQVIPAMIDRIKALFGDEGDTGADAPASDPLRVGGSGPEDVG